MYLILQAPGYFFYLLNHNLNHPNNQIEGEWQTTNPGSKKIFFKNLPLKIMVNGLRTPWKISTQGKGTLCPLVTELFWIFFILHWLQSFQTKSFEKLSFEKSASNRERKMIKIFFNFPTASLSTPNLPLKSFERSFAFFNPRTKILSHTVSINFSSIFR